MKVSKGKFLVNICLIIIVFVSCQSKTTVSPKQNTIINQLSDSINTSTITDSNNLNEQKSTLDKDELTFYKENYERERSLRKNIFNDYRYAINEISPSLDPSEAEKIIFNVNEKVVLMIQNKDFSELARYIHPLKGVRISCFNEASTEDVILYNESILSNEKYIWGIEWGSGNTIEMNIGELFDTLIYSKDYAQYTIIYNPKHLMNCTDGNEYIFYDKCISVLHLYEGEKTIDNIDWSGLKLVYQEHVDGNWYLVGIIHCERIM